MTTKATSTAKRGNAEKLEHVMSFRYSTHERDRVLKLKQHMAMPVEVEMAKLGRHCFLTGLVALERKHK